MPRGRIYAVYHTDADVLFSRQVDADAAADTNRGWDSTGVEGLPYVPIGSRLRHVIGRSSSTGRSAIAYCGTPTCDLWTGVATTFDVEATDGSADTMTVVGRRGERFRLSP